MSNRDELLIFRKKLLRDIRKYGRKLDFIDLVEQSIWCDMDQRDRRERERQIATYCLDKSRRELRKIDMALKKPRKSKAKPAVTGMAKKKYGDVVE